jgi:hypothetical protein
MFEVQREHFLHEASLVGDLEGIPLETPPESREVSWGLKHFPCFYDKERHCTFPHFFY